MLISHTNTGTLGDFAAIWPALSGLSKVYGPLDFTLPNEYSNKRYNGFAEFFLYQDFVNSLDFLDREADVDVQSNPNIDVGGMLPTQVHGCHQELQKKLNINFDIDYDFELKIPYRDVPGDIKNKYIVVDRVYGQPLKKHNLFQNKNEYYWIRPTIHNHGFAVDQEGDVMVYNLNVCVQSTKGVKSTVTGLPIVLQYFKNIVMEVVSFDPMHDMAWAHSYFQNNKNITWCKSHETITKYLI
jgi:hypothetical protein